MFPNLNCVLLIIAFQMCTRCCALRTSRKQYSRSRSCEHYNVERRRCTNPSPSFQVPGCEDDPWVMKNKEDVKAMALEFKKHLCYTPVLLGYCQMIFGILWDFLQQAFASKCRKLGHFSTCWPMIGGGGGTNDANDGWPSTKWSCLVLKRCLFCVAFCHG